MEGNGRGEEKVKGNEGERWREGLGPPKNFGVAPPMDPKWGPLTSALARLSCYEIVGWSVRRS